MRKIALILFAIAAMAAYQAGEVAFIPGKSGVVAGLVFVVIVAALTGAALFGFASNQSEE